MQTVPADAEAVGRQMVAPAQALRPLVIAQRPGAEHLEHGQMAVIADLVKIGRAQAALQAGQPPAPRVWPAFQVRGQRMHPRGGEQHRVAVRRHQRAALDHPVAPFSEEFKERTGRLGHVHGVGSFLAAGTRKGPLAWP